MQELNEGKTGKARKERTPMPEQPAEERRKNFNEVALGYTKEDALAEASRCLSCKDPKCVEGCPVNVDIPGFPSFNSCILFLPFSVAHTCIFLHTSLRLLSLLRDTLQACSLALQSQLYGRQIQVHQRR